ncbi:MAG: S8 family serine peptidase [Calditrichae bacterium]|nr:S8 family serine peptidase [Calditrichia bacterium]
MSRYVFFIIFFLVASAAAKDFFVKLSETGKQNRSELLLQQNNSSLTSASRSKKPNLIYKEIIPQKSMESKFSDWMLISVPDDTDPETLKTNENIAFVEPAGHFKIDFESADSLSADQWYLDKIDLTAAWKKTKGNKKVIVAIIDTGIDYVHPDLQKSIWINTGEDINGNGIFDPEDINHIDDDGNGYTDDVAGWDFTDAPRFADGGDYSIPDNEPWDEFGSGHGTQVAGIIAATDNNTIGICGIAPGVKVMNLRAGTASGYLEEDDVAKAIVYAIENGASIINMSFGDIALSRFLKDVIQYAYEKGIVMVASSGNSATNETHFPSGLSQTISVGASTENDGLAGFSNFGNTIDLVAPGTEMVSTAVGNTYNSVNGTSFSAPVVSAVAALILSENNTATVEQIRNILKSSSDDILYNGWDSYSGAGRVNAGKSLNIPFGGKLRIDSPAAFSASSADNIVVQGSAAHPDLQSVTLEYGFGESPPEWFLLNKFENEQILDDTLGTLNCSTFPDTILALKLKMKLLNGSVDELHTNFSIDRSVPRISDINIIPLWDGTSSSVLVTFRTDDICNAELLLKSENSNGEFESLASPFETTQHRIKVDDEFAGKLDLFKIRVRNGSNLRTENDNNGHLFKLSFTHNTVLENFSRVDWNLPCGYVFNQSTDLDHDGNREIILSRYSDDFAFGPIEIYEFNNGRFDLRLKTSFTAIPRAAGDVDNDGKSDMLLGFGQFTFLYEAPDYNTFPTELIWQDTSDFWGAAYTDLDNDGKSEICGRIGSDYVLLENTEDNTFVKTATLINSSPGENRQGIPKIEICDLNGDGKKDLFYGDYDGDILGFSMISDNVFEQIAHFKSIHLNATEMLTSDKEGLLLSATHTSSEFNYEHEFDARYWSVESFVNPLISTASIDTVNTFGFSDTRDFDSGLVYKQFDDRLFLFASFFPDLFVFEKKDKQWQIVWHSSETRSNTVLVDDFDGDGFDEFYFNTGKAISGYTNKISERPQPPLLLQTIIHDSARIDVRWQKVQNAWLYNVYRGNEKENLHKIASTDSTFFPDSTVITEEKYYYAVTSVDSVYAIPESFFSVIDSAKTGLSPKFESLEFVNDRQMIIYFDKKLAFLNTSPVKILRSRGMLNSSSDILTNGEKAILVSFADPFLNTVPDTLILENVFSAIGVPLSATFRRIPFIYMTSDAAKPYVKESFWQSDKTLQIQFSQNMIPALLLDVNNYKLYPSGSVKNAHLADSSSKSVLLTFNDQTIIGAKGQQSYLELINLKSTSGILMDEANIINLFKVQTELEKIVIYPQPLKAGNAQLMFSNLPDGDFLIRIFSMNGAFIRAISRDSYYGGIPWDLKDSHDEKVPSGVYLYDIHWNGKTKQGKLVIVR